MSDCKLSYKIDVDVHMKLFACISCRIDICVKNRTARCMHLKDLCSFNFIADNSDGD